MSRILKLLTTLCGQGTVLALMALATSGMATDAKASDWAPPAEDTVTFNSDSGRESSRATIPLKGTRDNNITITFESKAGHDSNAYCNHRAWVVDWEVVIDDDEKLVNRPIELKLNGGDLRHAAGKYQIPITLCKRGIGETFKVAWTATKDIFDDDESNCDSKRYCYTEVTIYEEDPPVATLVLTPATIDESGNTNTSAVTATLDKAADVDVTIGVSPAADGEFTLSPNSDLTISAGSTTSTGTVTITAVDNLVDAPDKTVKVSATARGAGVEAPEGKTLTINDNDTRGLVISKNALSVSEGGTASYTVKLATEPTGTVTVTIASDNTDVTASPTSLNFHASGGSKPWNEAQTVTVSAGQDSDTNDDSATLAHTTSGGDYSSETGSVTVTVNDDDGTSQPAASFDSGSSSAAESAGTRNVRVSLSQTAPSGGLTLGYSVTGTATSGSGNDFTIQNSGTLTITAGTTSADIPVVINDDSTQENAETIILTLADGTGYTVGSPGVHTVTIADDDGTGQAILSLSGTASASEGNSGTSDKYFTVSLSKAPSRFVSWQLCFSGSATIDAPGSGTIPASADYQAISGPTPIDLRGRSPVCTSRTFKTTDSSFTNTDIGIRIKGDTDSESDETVIATLKIGDGPADVVLGTSEVTYTILDDDGTSQPAASFDSGSSSAAESAGTRNVRVSLSQTAPSGGLTLGYSVTGTATSGSGNDFTIQNSGTLTITAGTTSADIPVVINDDSTQENAETIILTLTGGTGYTVGNPSVHTLTITDNDGPLPAQPAASFDLTTSSAAENAGTHIVTVNLNAAAPSGGLTLSYDVSGTATAGNGNDFTIQNSGTLSVAAGATTATIPVAINDDSINEEAETVILTLTGGTGYTLGSPKVHTLTITDNDGPLPARSSPDGVRSFSIDDATAMEKDGTINFTVRLSAATRGNSQASVRVATRDVTAVSGLDYRSLNNKLVVFQAGETEKVVKVELINDAHNEGAETFEVVLSNPSNAVIGDGVATGTINNADYVPQSELAHFGRSVANHVLEGVIDRISSPRSPGASARIAGNVVGKADRAPDPDCPGCGVLSTDRRVEKFDREEILTDSSFVLNGQDDSSHSPAFWGRGTRSYFRDKPGNLSVDGEVTSFILGADLGWSDRKIVGLALIRSSGKIDHMEKPGVEDPNTGMTKLTLTALVPYAGWKINDSIDVWGALGHGNGKMELDLNAGDTSEMIKTSFDWTMAAAGLRGDVVRPGPDGGPQLTALLDGYRVKTSSKETEGLAASKASVTRLRAGLEASWEMQLEDGSILVPRMETNLIQEIGDVGSGFGLELVGGLSWSDPDTGLAVDLSARRLRSHDSPGRKDHGYSMALVYDPNPESERGLSVSMRQDRGNSESTMDGLLTSGLPETTAEDSISSQWTTELAYGFPVIDGSFTGSPHAGIEETDDYRDYKVGWRLTPAGPQAPDLSFDINAARRESLLSNSADHRLGVGLVAEW